MYTLIFWNAHINHLKWTSFSRETDTTGASGFIFSAGATQGIINCAKPHQRCCDHAQSSIHLSFECTYQSMNGYVVLVTHTITPRKMHVCVCTSMCRGWVRSNYYSHIKNEICRKSFPYHHLPLLLLCLPFFPVDPQWVGLSKGRTPHHSHCISNIFTKENTPS